jgi:hypothetical protein
MTNKKPLPTRDECEALIESALRHMLRGGGDTKMAAQAITIAIGADVERARKEVVELIAQLHGVKP